MNVTNGYDELLSFKSCGVELTPQEVKIVKDGLLKYRKGRAFKDLLFLDQMEVLFWIVGYCMENDIEAPNLKRLLRLEIIENFKQSYINSISWDKLDRMVFDEIVSSYNNLKQNFPNEN